MFRGSVTGAAHDYRQAQGLGSGAVPDKAAPLTPRRLADHWHVCHHWRWAFQESSLPHSILDPLILEPPAPV